MIQTSWYHRNKERQYQSHKTWSDNNREYNLARKREWYYKEGWKRDLQKKYGMSEEQYFNILIKQDYKCAICLLNEKDMPKRLCVDHNHETGVVRGLLCYDCNRNFIGKHNDPEKYFRAAKYLENTN